MNHEPSSPCHFCTPFCLSPKAGRARADPRSHWRGRSGRSAVRPARWRHHFCHCRQPGQGAAPARHGSEVHHQQPRCQGHWMVMWSLVFFWGLGRFLWGGSRSFGESEGFGWLKNKNVMIIWKSVRVLWLCITNQEDISGRWLRPLLKSPRLPKTMLVDSLLQDSLLILRHGVGTLPLNDSFWLVIWKIMFFSNKILSHPPSRGRNSQAFDEDMKRFMKEDGADAEGGIDVARPGMPGGFVPTGCKTNHNGDRIWQNGHNYTDKSLFWYIYTYI